MGRATFWAISSQTHLVTLPETFFRLIIFFGLIGIIGSAWCKQICMKPRLQSRRIHFQAVIGDWRAPRSNVHIRITDRQNERISLKLPPGFDLTIHCSSLHGGRRRRYHYRDHATGAWKNFFPVNINILYLQTLQLYCMIEGNKASSLGRQTLKKCPKMSTPADPAWRPLTGAGCPLQGLGNSQPKVD
jgi:hypothetical protein